MNKRLEFVHEIYQSTLKKMVEHKDLKFGTVTIGKTIFQEPQHYHPAFKNFYAQHKEIFQDFKIDGKSINDVMFDYFIFCDPTDRKKYVQWMVTLFREYQITVSKEHESQSKMNDIGGTMYNFFEDLLKVSEAIERYEYLKLTNTFKVEEKQINKFKNYKDLIDLVQPYMAKEGDATVHTLDHKEIKVLKNEHEATVFTDTAKHIVVITHTKEANAEFGKFTTWCTSGTRWGNQMFDSYHKRGPLFVVIKKGFGSKNAIESNASNRIQLHFESKSYMDAKDRSISLRNLLNEDEELKNAFRGYFETKYLKKVEITQEVLNFLLDLGYTDVLMDILAVVKPKVLSLSNYKIEEIHLKKIFKLTSIETLDLTATDISFLPDEIRHLVNLKELHVRNNSKLTEIPAWIGELKKLEILNVAGCDISGQVDLTGLTLLRQFIADFNSHISSMPNGLETCISLQRMNLSYCNLSEVDISVTLKNLELLDVHENPNLTKISERTMANTPGLVVLATACTAIPNDMINKLENIHPCKDLNIVHF